jgi:DNA-directed RNA polymerase subunit N (RpoN/RPB10)
MIVPVRCTCGKSLAAYYNAYKLARQEKMRSVLAEHKGEILPEMMALCDDLQPMMGDILDTFGMTRECCRQKLLTTCEFSDYY